MDHFAYFTDEEISTEIKEAVTFGDYNLFLLVGLVSFTEIFSSTVTTSNNQTFADRFLGVMVGIGFTLWAVLRYLFGKEFEKNEI